MKARIKQPQKTHILLRILKERRIIQNMFIFLIGAIGVVASVYEITPDERIRKIAFIICITGAPIVAIVSWFHGKGGKNPITKMEALLITLCILIGGGFAAKTLIWPPTMPRSITILIRMMDQQERWFIENIIRDFEKKNRCEVTVERFENELEIVKILESQRKMKNSSNVSLVKTPLPLTLVLYREGLVMPFEDILMDLKLGRPEIESRLRNIEDEYDYIALKMCSFDTITGKKLFFLPRKLETRLMIYRKSKVADAVKKWRKFEAQLNDIVKKENGYGLPRNFNLESDVNSWDYYDILVVAYYWANTEYNGEKSARIAHRSRDYAGTSRGLIDRALQLGAIEETIRDMYKFSDPIIDMFQWEAIFRKYNLYCKDMWQANGWSGLNIYEGIKRESVFLAWMHQLDCLLICGCEQLGIRGYLDNKEDFGVAIMPLGVAFELTKDGLSKRTGSRLAHTFGWFWGIPKDSPEPELAYKLARFITSKESHLEECKNFFLIPVRKDASDKLNVDLKSNWKYEIYITSLKQLKLNRETFVPVFKTLADYQEFLDDYYHAFEEIVIKRKYSPEGPKGKVDRNFIRENLR